MTAPIETSTYVVEQLGPWRAADIAVRFDLTEFHPPADRRELIEQTWQSEQAGARRAGFEMFNGKLARMAAVAGSDARLEVTVQPTDFRTFLASNLVHPERFAPAERADAMGVSAVIRASDQQLVLGQRSQKVAYNRGKVHTIGGVLDWIRPAGPADQPADGTWLFDQLLKELFEELALLPEQIQAVTAMALARDKRVWQPELLCVAQVAITADELAANLRRSGEDEHVGLWTCRDTPEAIAEAMTNQGGTGFQPVSAQLGKLCRQEARLTPVAVAAMLAYASRRHGLGGVEALLGGLAFGD